MATETVHHEIESFERGHWSREVNRSKRGTDPCWIHRRADRKIAHRFLMVLDEFHERTPEPLSFLSGELQHMRIMTEKPSRTNGENQRSTGSGKVQKNGTGRAGSLEVRSCRAFPQGSQKDP